MIRRGKRREEEEEEGGREEEGGGRRREKAGGEREGQDRPSFQLAMPVHLTLLVASPTKTLSLAQDDSIAQQ